MKSEVYYICEFIIGDYNLIVIIWCNCIENFSCYKNCYWSCLIIG